MSPVFGDDVRQVAPPSPSTSAGGEKVSGSPLGLTIQELALASGVPSRTIRFYQSKGTLAPPERRGRVAYYGADHVERLRVIGELQDRGLRLDAIRDALEQVGRGGPSLQEWLGVGDELQVPWTDDRSIVATEAELLERFADHPGLIGEMRRLGIIERQGNTRPVTYVMPSAVLLEIAVELLGAGIDIELAVHSSEIIRASMSRLSDELVGYYASHAGDGFGGGGRPDEILESFDALRPQGMRAVQVIFAQEMERALRVFVERGGSFPRQPRSGHGQDRQDGHNGHNGHNGQTSDRRMPGVLPADRRDDGFDDVAD